MNPQLTVADCNLLLSGLKALVQQELASSGLTAMMSMVLLGKKDGKEFVDKSLTETKLKCAQIEESTLALQLKLVQLRNRLSEHEPEPAVAYAAPDLQ